MDRLDTSPGVPDFHDDPDAQTDFDQLGDLTTGDDTELTPALLVHNDTPPPSLIAASSDWIDDLYRDTLVDGHRFEVEDTTIDP